jgi:hypothetical protein
MTPSALITAAATKARANCPVGSTMILVIQGERVPVRPVVAQTSGRCYEIGWPRAYNCIIIPDL